MQEKLLDIFSKSIESGNWLTVIVIAVVIVALRVNLRGILEFLERNGTKRERYIKEMLKIKAINSVTRAFLVEEINYITFRKITGISADKINREKVDGLVDRSNGELPAFRIARAWKYIKMRDRKLVVEITSWDKVENYFNRVSAGVMMIFAMWCFVLLIDHKDATAYQAASLVIVGVMAFLAAMFLVWQNIPMSIAKKIEPLIVRLQTETTDSGRAEVAASPSQAVIIADADILHIAADSDELGHDQNFPAAKLRRKRGELR